MSVKFLANSYKLCGHICVLPNSTTLGRYNEIQVEANKNHGTQCQQWT